MTRAYFIRFIVRLIIVIVHPNYILPKSNKPVGKCSNNIELFHHTLNVNKICLAPHKAYK